MHSFKDVAVVGGTCLFVLVIILLPVVLPILSPPIYEGVVVKKSHTPRSVYMMPMNTGKTITHVPRIRPESYSLTISDGEKEATHSVDKRVYETTSIGDRINLKDR
jgi:hypothetical protein